jgi:hypothetical protein
VYIYSLPTSSVLRRSLREKSCFVSLSAFE